MRRPGSGSSVDAPGCLEDRAHVGVLDVAVARQLVRERAHVAGALHVVLAAQRVHAHALAADVAGRHGEVGDAHDRGRALAVLGDAEAVVDRGVAAGGVEPRRGAQRPPDTPVAASMASGLLRGSATNSAQSWNSSQSQRSRTKASSTRPSVTMTWAIALSTATLVPGRSGRWWSASTCGDAHEVDPARVDDDQLGALAQPLLHPRGEDRVAVGRVGADHHHHVAILDGVEVLGAGRGAEGLSSGRSRSASGRRGRRCRRCCCRRRRAPASGRGRSPRWCSATR